MSHESVSCGIDYSTCVDISSCLEDAATNRYDFVCIPLVHPRYKRDFLHDVVSHRPGPYSRSDMTLSCKDWSNLVVGKISPWLQLESSVHHVRKNSEMALMRELEWSAHLSLPAILVELKSGNCYNLARALSEHSLGYANTQFWIRVPLVAPKAAIDTHIIEGGEEETDDPESGQDTWKWWNTLRCLTHRRKSISVCLEMSADLPCEEVMDRWYGEPIKSILLSTTLFVNNKNGFPVLSPAHQSVLRRFFKLHIQVIISGNCMHEKGPLVYQQYMEHLFKTMPPSDVIDAFSKGFEDHLQVPLQPLMDNLESHTYETFEQDPTKYTKYEEAVREALVDRVPDANSTQTTIVMVVGAGRGPLVRASLAAAKKCGRKIKVFAVEKNPNAVITLENMQQYEWGDLVTVVSCDMREWQPSELADILVSELLGSFGDNELSPECLDGAQRYLKEDGVSIPCSYSSWLVPIQCPKLHADVRTSREKDKHPDSCFETPYVVRFTNCNILSHPTKVFTFTHPKRGPIDNERYGSFTFDISTDTVMHGFSGYFDTVLYKDIMLSIVPETHSPGMFSWFPLFFPLKDPVQLTAGCKVTVHMWRRVTSKNVWYEWTISEPYPVPIHNPKGRSYTIGL